MYEQINPNFSGDTEKTKEHLENELNSLHRQIDKLNLPEIKQKQIEEGIFLSLVEAANDSIISADNTGNIIFWNQGAEKMFSYSSNEILGKPITYIIPEEFRDAYQNAMNQLTETGNQNIIENKLELSGRREDGFEFPIELSLAAWNSKKELFFTAMIRDITERKQMENALRTSEEYAMSFLESSQDFVCNITTDGKFLNLNPVGCEIIGIDNANEIVGKNCTDKIVENREAVENALKQAAAGNNASVQYKMITNKNLELFLDAKITPVVDLDGSIRSILKVARDITSQKKAELKLQQNQKELEAAYKELKVSQTHIFQQEKMASIGQLAAGVAHEINNPMGFISSNLGTLGKYLDKLTEFINSQTGILESLNATTAIEEMKDKRKKLKLDFVLEDIKDLIGESLDGADRVKKIVQNLKSFSRVDEADYKFVDINECMESTLNIVWNELKYKTTVEKEYGELPLSKCYPQQLNQVFMNILVNAAQAIEKQGVIKIKTWNGAGFINVSISDTGQGIPKDKIDKIFEPFYTSKEIGKGTGLGLSITYDIVNKHNGEITVDSELGKGTTFLIKIPVVEGNQN